MAVMSGFVAPKGNEFDIGQIPTAVLGTCTSILSKDLIKKLGSELKPYAGQVSRELGLSPTLSLADDLAVWCCSPGSTVFVLVSVLRNIGRLDFIQWILADIEMRTMHLYVKVEEVAKDGLCISSPKYHQVTTNSGFSLIQALENILGGDLTHYEISGPGHWVTWSTRAEELKGQMLTLRYHPSPVAQTCEDLYGHATSNTEMKKPVSMYQNIPVFMMADTESEMSLQFTDPTNIEDLKYGAAPSSISDSNNATADNSLEKGTDFAMAESMMHEGPTKYCVDLTLDTREDQFTLDSATHMKVPVLPGYTSKEMSMNKLCPDKVIVTKGFESEQKQGNITALDALNNVPFLSVLQQGFCGSMSNNNSFAAQQETTVKQMEVEECEFKQNNLNCTSVTFHSFHPNSLRTGGQMKSSECKMQVSNSSGVFSKIPSEVDCEDKMDQNMDGEQDYKTEPAKNVEIGSLALSLQSKIWDKYHVCQEPVSSDDSNTQEIVLPVSSSDMQNYIPHSYIQSIPGLVRRDRSVTDPPSPCQSPNQVRTPPQKRHCSGPAHPSPSPSSHPNIYTQQPHLQGQDKHFMHHQQQAVLNQTSAIDSEGQHPQQFLPLHLSNQQNTHTLVDDAPSHELPRSQPYLNVRQYQSQPTHSQRQPQQTTTQASLICHTPPSSFQSGGNTAQNQLSSSCKPSMFHPQLMQTNFRPSGTEQAVNESQNAMIYSQEKPELRNTQFLDVSSQNQSSVNMNGDYMLMHDPTLKVTPKPNNQTFRQELQLKPPTAKSSPQEPVKMVLKSGDPIQIVSHSDHFIHGHGAVGGAEGGLLTESQHNPHSGGISMPFRPAPLPHVRNPSTRLRNMGPNIHSQMSPEMQRSMVRRDEMAGTNLEEDQRYSYIDTDQLERQISGSNSQRSGDHVMSSPGRMRESLEDDLAQLEGWSPHENGDTIQKTMEKYRKHDGCYVVWKSRRHNKFVITVSHMSQLIYLRVEEAKTDTNKTLYYLFQDGFHSESLKDLVEHYAQNGLRVPVPVQSAGRQQKVYNEHISLRYPLRVCVDSQRKVTAKSK